MAQTLEEVVKLQLGHLTLTLAMKDVEIQNLREQLEANSKPEQVNKES